MCVHIQAASLVRVATFPALTLHISTLTVCSVEVSLELYASQSGHNRKGNPGKLNIFSLHSQKDTRMISGDVTENLCTIIFYQHLFKIVKFATTNEYLEARVV